VFAPIEVCVVPNDSLYFIRRIVTQCIECFVDRLEIHILMNRFETRAFRRIKHFVFVVYGNATNDTVVIFESLWVFSSINYVRHLTRKAAFTEICRDTRLQFKRYLLTYFI
jgi:hypothetical protein